MKKIYFYLLFISTFLGFSQTISVNTTTYTVPQLVQDVLIDSPCALVSNFSSSPTCGIGYFQYTGSNFDFSSGVILRNGNVANSAGNYTDTNLTSTCSLTGDAQLQAISDANGGTQSINDVSFIQFDFTPLTDRFSFNYVFASNEYGTFQCNFSDVFAFILTDLTTGISTNLAVVPTTTTPVSVTTIREDDYNSLCASSNPSLFDTYNVGNPAAVMNMRGYTVPLTAFADVIPNRNYRIKLVIGDYQDTQYDSAVFIEAGSFNVGLAQIEYPYGVGIVTDDMTEVNGFALCPGETKVIDSGLDPADYNFVWTLNTGVLVGETGSTLVVDQPGTYCVQASNISGPSCTQTDCIIVEYLPGITLNPNPNDLYSCDYVFNLNDNISSILGALSPSDYDVSFYATQADAEAGTPQLPSPAPTAFVATNIVTPIYVRVENFTTPCPAFTQFDAIVNTVLPTASISGTTTIPAGSTAVITFTGTPNATVTYNINGGPNQTIVLNASGIATLTTPALTVTTTYNILSVFDGSCTASLTGSAVVTVTNDPTSTISANTICSGQTGTLTFTGTPGAEVLFTDGVSNFTVTLDASGNATFTTVALTADTTYTLISATTVTPPATASLTASATVVVVGLPTATISGTTSICSGSTTTISFSGTAGAVVTYTINAGANQTITLDASGNATLTTPALTADTTYALVSVALGSCSQNQTGSALVTILPLPTASISGTTTICSGTTTTISFSGTANATVTYTVDSGAPQTIVLDAAGNATLTTPILTAPSTYALVSVASMSVPVCTSTVSGNAVISIQALPTATIAANTICSGQTGTLTFTGTPGALVTFFDGTSNQTVTLDASGNATYTTGVLTADATYSLVSAATTVAPICSQTQTGSATVVVTALPTATISGTTSICSGSTTTISFSGTAGAVVTYTINAGANQTITLDASGNATLTTSALTADTTYALVSVAAACATSISGSAMITILPLPTATIAANTICTGNTGEVTFTGTPNADVTFTDGITTQTITLNGSGAAVYTTPILVSNTTYTLVSVATTTAPICNQTLTGSATVIVNQQPVVTATPASETICSGTNTNINLSSTITGTTYTWTVVATGVTGASNGSGSIINQSLSTTTAGVDGMVVYTITPTAAGCTGLPITVQVNVTSRPEVTITSASTSYCDGSVTNITLSSTIPGTTYTWNALSSNLDTTLVFSGSGSTISQTLDLVNNLNVGFVTYSVTPFANGCSGTPQQITIYANPIPEMTASPTLSEICSGDTAHIDFTSNISGVSYSWTFSATGVTGASNGSGTSIDQVLTSSDATTGGFVIYTITPELNGCLGTSVTVQVDVKPRPEFFGTIPTTILCSGETTNIGLSASITGTNFEWTVVSSNITGASDGSGIAIVQTLEAPSVTGTAVYTVVPVLNGCYGSPITVTVTVNPLPKPVLEDGTLCIIQATGEVYQTYTLNTGLSATGYSFDWYFNGGLIAGANAPTYTADEVGLYSVIVTNTTTTCESEEVFATVDFVNPATSFSTVVTEAFTNNATITVSVPDGTGTLLYQLDEGAYQESNVFTGVSAGEHTVTVIDTEGCTFMTQTVLVIDYPKYFTPNGDGHNDTWNIIGMNQADAKLYIFDRYGKLIKQISPSSGSDGWDGTYNGQQLPSTDYWFSLDYTENGAAKQFKAHFSMKR